MIEASVAVVKRRDAIPRPSRDRRPPTSFAPTIDFTKTSAPSPKVQQQQQDEASTSTSEEEQSQTGKGHAQSKLTNAAERARQMAWRMRTGCKALYGWRKPLVAVRALPARMSKSVAIVASASPTPMQYMVDDEPAIRAAIRLSQEKAEKQARGHHNQQQRPAVREKRKSRQDEEEGEEEEEEEEDEEWIVEKIIAVRPDGRGVKYQVRWRGFSADEDTFEPFEHIKDTEAYIRFIAINKQQEDSHASPAKKKRKTADDEEEEEEEEEEEAEEEEEPKETASKKQQLSKSASSSKVASSTRRRPLAQLPPSPPESPASSRSASLARASKSKSSTTSAAASASRKNQYIASSYSIPESGDRLVPPMPVPAAERSPSDGQLAPLFSSRFNVTILGQARPSNIPAEVAVYRMNQEGKLEWADARDIVKSYQEKVAVKALASGKKHAAAADREEHKSSTK